MGHNSKLVNASTDTDKACIIRCSENLKKWKIVLPHPDFNCTEISDSSIKDKSVASSASD